MLEDLRFRLRALVRRVRTEDDLDDELRFHLERTVEQHVARGLSAREARRRARLGVIAHAVARRTREIGIRMALGAAPRDVLELVARQGAVLVGLGAAVGLALAFAAARATAGVLFGIDAADPLAWGGGSSPWSRSAGWPTSFRRGGPCGWPRRRRCGWSETARLREV